MCVITTALIQSNFPSAFEPTEFIKGFIWTHPVKAVETRRFGAFQRNRSEPGCRCRTEDVAAEGFIPLGIFVKGKSVTMILPIKNEGIFIVTLGFFEAFIL